MNISEILTEWYEIHKRNLPWRGIENPYFIWISEIILQQTRVSQGWNYYEKFISRFPDISALANASEDEVLLLWQGLGYYSRARNLHHTAKHILKYFNGIFPNRYETLIKLKGIGEYTAAAILSFAFKKPFPVVDGNVNRVISRFFGVTEPVDLPDIRKKIYILAKNILNEKKPDIHNQAIMEFGALQCVPQNPDCANCPLQSGCVAFSKNCVEKIPAKKPKKEVENRYFHYFFVKQNEKTFIRKRQESDIWRNLYEFPLLETEKNLSETEIFDSQEFKKLFPDFSKFTILNISQIIEHQLTHQKIFTRFYEISLSQNFANSYFFENFKNIDFAEISDFAVPKLIENYLKN